MLGGLGRRQHHAFRIADEAFEGVFALFPDFKKVRSSAASAEMTRQVEKSTPAAYQILDFAVWQSSRKISSNLGL